MGLGVQTAILFHVLPSGGANENGPQVSNYFFSFNSVFIKLYCGIGRIHMSDLIRKPVCSVCQHQIWST